MARKDLVECPHCGESFPRGRLACPECGSDDRTGWLDGEEIDYQSVDIPDYWEEPSGSGRKTSRLWLLAAVLALVGMVLWVVLR